MRRMVVLLAVVALVLPACSGDEGDQGTRTSTPGASASESPVDSPTAIESPTASPTPDLYRTEYDVPPWDELVAMYEYDASQPFDYRVTGESKESGATMYEITYRSGSHKVPARLVIPDGSGPFPVIVYAPSNDIGISWFGGDSMEMARAGYAGLLVSSPEGRPPYTCFYWTCWQPEKALKAMTTYVIDISRGIDLIESLPEIDAERIGFVGHGIGGDVGAILSGIDDRIDAFAIDGPDAFYGDIAVDMAHAGEGPPLDEIPAYQDGVASLNAVNYVGHNRSSAFLMQVGTAYRDDTADRLQILFDALPEPKTWKWQDGDIFFGCSRYGDCDPGLPLFVFHRRWLEKNV